MRSENMFKLSTLFVVVLFCFSINGCTQTISKNNKQKSELKVSPELQKAIGNIDQMDSNKIKNIPIDSLDVSF